MSDFQTAKKFLRLRKSAMDRGLEFNLSLCSVRNLVNAKRCYYTRVTLNDVPDHPNQRTIDRIDNSKGYIKGNVVACTKRINLAKGNLTVEEIIQIHKGVNK